MSENLPTVSVIIPARDTADDLPRALDSISSQTYPNIVDVVVAAADDATAEAASGRALIVRNEAGSTSAALNLAVEGSQGEVIVRCDARSILPPDYIARAVETLERTKAATVGGMQVPIGETPLERAIAAAMSSALGAGDARYRIGGEEGPVETVYLGVFKRDALESVGGFDESFTRNQDYELNHRLIETGETVWFDPELKVAYRPRGSIAALARQYFQYGQAKRRFNRRHPGHLRLRQLGPPVLTVALAVSLLAAPWFPVLLLVPAAYAVALIAGSTICEGAGMRTAVALAVMHLSWGAGFLVGSGSATDQP